MPNQYKLEDSLLILINNNNFVKILNFNVYGFI